MGCDWLSLVTAEEALPQVKVANSPFLIGDIWEHATSLSLTTVVVGLTLANKEVFDLLTSEVYPTKAANLLCLVPTAFVDHIVLRDGKDNGASKAIGVEHCEVFAEI